ncbi:hypothetical protein EHS25_004749 [Saitozyma podzolica]|uniref:Uncharacterized protein n=1 Tax=Saitozyma podzolica TaxID=1890683 RepID=A0A427Y2U4_9TREE|nr:hypothetical protein EHS25_004749 [Saitozyma podzolica]
MKSTSTFLHFAAMKIALASSTRSGQKMSSTRRYVHIREWLPAPWRGPRKRAESVSAGFRRAVRGVVPASGQMNSGEMAAAIAKMLYWRDDCTQIEVKAGDVSVTHGLNMPAHTSNHLHYARVINNQHVYLAKPFNLNRADGDNVDTPADNAKTLCEQLTLRGLIRQSTPENKPTPERLAFYPCKAYYKREKVKAELERVITDAKAKGLPAESVDRVYLGGEEPILEHERRNG